MKKDLEQFQKQQIQRKTSRKSWKKILWGTENPRAILANTALLFFAGFLMYGVLTKGFFPSEQFSATTLPILWVICVGGSIAYYRAYVIGKIKIKQVHKKLKPLILVLVPFINFLVPWASTIGFARAYTEIFGKPAEKAITVNIKRHPKYNEKCLESEELNTGIYIRLCIKREDYLKIKDGDILRTSGMESWFGYVFEKYEKPK